MLEPISAIDWMISLTLPATAAKPGGLATESMSPASRSSCTAWIMAPALVKPATPLRATFDEAPQVSSMAPDSGELGAPSWKTVFWCGVESLMRFESLVSSMAISLPDPVRMMFFGALPEVTGLAVCGLGTVAAMMGRSGSPSTNVRMTSTPGRRGKCMPYPGPECGWAMRTRREPLAGSGPVVSNMNWTR